MCIFASCQCADYARTSYAGAGEAHVACVTFAVGEAVWCGEELFSAGDKFFSVRYKVFTAGEELFRVGDKLLTVATAFDGMYMYVCNNIPRYILSMTYHIRTL